MMRHQFSGTIKSLKAKAASKPDKSIIISGVILAFSFLLIALPLHDKALGDLAINLSASMITVVLTVVLVDRLRQLHLTHELNEPRTEAIRRVKVSNNIMILLLSVINFGSKTGFKGVSKDTGDFFNESVHDKETTRLAMLDSSKLKPFSNVGTRNSLKQSAESISRELTSVRQNYDYALDNDFKTTLNKMINAAEGLKGIWVIYELDSTTLESFSDAGGDDFVRIQLHTYLKAYSEFLMRYKING